MTKLSRNLAVKIGAICLFVCMVLAAAGCLFGSLYVTAQDWDRDGISYYDTEQCRATAKGVCMDIALAAASGSLSQEWIEAYLYPGNMQIESFWAVDALGNEIVLELPLSAEGTSELLPDPAGESMALYVKITDTNMESETPQVDYGETVEGFYNEELPHVVVDCAAVVGDGSLQRIPAFSDDGPAFSFSAANCRLQFTLDPLLYGDAHEQEYRLFQLFYPLQDLFLPLFLVCCLIGFIGFCFLMVSAGRRKGQEGISLNHQDRIPLDLYLTAAIFLEVLAATALPELFYEVRQNWPQDGGSFLFLLLFLLAAAMVLVFLGCCMTIATRLKRGRWWRNTVVFFLLWLVSRFFRGCWRLLRSIAEALPMSWFLVLGGLVLLLAEALLLSASLTVYRFRGFLLVFILFNLALLVALCFLGRNLQRLRKAGRHLAAGEFDFQVDTRHMLPPLAQHGRDLNAIGQGMAIAVEQRTKSERLKTELITNVSHDIKTPLTSIINYVDLLQKKHSPEQEKEYLAVLARQSQRLKKLTEDLVEASKASTGNIQAELLPTNVNEILNQAAAEYSERFREAELEVQLHLPELPLEILADGRLLWRVVDNLLNNVLKYTLSGTRVYIDAFSQGKFAFITIKNVSREALNISSDELMERFVRGDSSRNTEGSGLGLNIARSLTDLQGGRLSLHIDGDLFKAELSFPLLLQ